VNEAKESFPRRSARTRRFTLGRPRSFSVAADGSRVAFLRSPAGDDPLTGLWVLDVETGTERLVADPRTLDGSIEEQLSAVERARRERARETAGGIVSYAPDPALRLASFALSGVLFLADLVTGDVRALPAKAPVFDPRPAPTGEHVAYVNDGAFRVVSVPGDDRCLAEDEDPDVTWGLAEFIAAEEMGRLRGFWWSPDGRAIAVARVDTRPVGVWYIPDPSDPASEPQRVRYPAAGTANADVSLFVLDLDGSGREVEWDRGRYPYMVQVTWGKGEPLSLLVQSRDQRRWTLLEVDPATGATRSLLDQSDADWLEIVSGIPAWTDDGGLVFTRDEQGTRRLTIDGDAVTPPDLHVRRVVHAGDGVTFTASEDDPTVIHLWRTSSEGKPRRLTDAPGVHDGVAGGDVLVVILAGMESSRQLTEVRRQGKVVADIRSLAEQPGLEPQVSMARAGRREIDVALLLPRDHASGEALPVLLDPYGGPHFQRVVRAQDAFLQSQWLADQGFAVVVADGRGTPGRGTAWEKAIHLDLATPALEDQVDALRASAEANPDLDMGRVAIRGWSFGGYLAALALLRRPDVFHAAIAGAPVTDWRLYDTHYTERFLGHPDDNPEAYLRSSLLDDAASLSRPLLLIHGLADDNVVAAHTLRLSRALLEAGRSHTVLPLSGVTHMTPQEVVAENLLLLQVAFLKEALHLGESGEAQR
jgi:dipeptidyl-peptidase 4